MHLRAEYLKNCQVEIANSYSKEIGILFQLSNNSEAFIEQQRTVNKLSNQLDKIGEMIKADRRKK